MAASTSSIAGFHFQVTTQAPFRADHQKKPVTHRQTPAKLEEPDSPTIEVDDVKDPVLERKEKEKPKHKSKLMMALGGANKKEKSLSKAAEAKLRKHADSHSAKHMEFMRIEMEAGRTFKQAHKMAMERYGT